MPATPEGDDVDRIARIREAWERLDNTGDISMIDDHLAEDIVLMPPGAPSIAGKEAVVQAVSGKRDHKVDQASEALLISGDLAVDRITVTATRDSTSANYPLEMSLKGVDVYWRDVDGAWKCIITIWNHQG